MPAVVLDHDGVAALAFNQGRDVGVAQVTLEDQQVAFPVTELRTITNESGRCDILQAAGKVPSRGFLEPRGRRLRRPSARC